MNAEIICVGTELLLGDILNTNVQFLSRQLAAMGINVYYQTSVGDNPERLTSALETAIERSNLIIFTGGLGPTKDDITVKTVCDAIGYELYEDSEAKSRIISYHNKLGKEMPENNLKQALLPKGATVFYNSCGTAPGAALECGDQAIIFLPGPPKEMQTMFNESVAQYLTKFSDGAIKSTFLNIFGIGESKVDELIADLLGSKNPTVAPYAKDGEVTLRITAKAQTPTAAEALCQGMIKELRSRFGTAAYGTDGDTLQSVAVSLLKEKGLTLATAESCTAGYISKRITDVPGSSSVFLMGVTTYSNQSKTNELSVDAELIRQYGAVSAPVAAAMANGVRKKSGADIGISITGIAGPDSDGTDKPVGLSYIGLADKDKVYVIESRKGSDHDREYIRYASASEAINMLREYLLTNSQTPHFSGLIKLEENSQMALNEENNNQELSQDDVLDDILKKDEPENDATDEYVSELQKLIDNKLSVDNETPTAEPLPVFPELDFGTISPDATEETEDEKAAEAPDVTEAGAFEQISYDDEKPLDIDDGVELFSAAQGDAYEENEEIKEAPEEGKKKKKNIFVRIISYLFPVKGDTGKEVARKLVFLVAIVALIIALSQIIWYYLDPMIAQKVIDDTRAAYHQESDDSKFLDLLEVNSDTIGWITIDGTGIDYPVVQTDNNDYYLNHGFDRSWTSVGTVFLDKNCSIGSLDDPDSETTNLILYGHHTRSKTMFSELVNYKDLDYYKKHPTITFDTLYKDSEWKIVACMLTNAFSNQDNGQVFAYNTPEFTDDTAFLTWAEECKLRSIIDTNVDVVAGDTMLTLQTCAYDFTEARMVIVARRVRDGESAEVDVDSATVNSDCKYPQAWYDKYGTYNPYAEGYTLPEITAANGSVIATQAVVIPTSTHARTLPNTAFNNDDNNNNANNNANSYRPNSNQNNNKTNATVKSNTSQNKTQAATNKATSAKPSGGNVSTTTKAPAVQQTTAAVATPTPTEPAADTTAAPDTPSGSDEDTPTQGSDDDTPTSGEIEEPATEAPAADEETEQ